jgi:hypothetical protein
VLTPKPLIPKNSHHQKFPLRFATAAKVQTTASTSIYQTGQKSPPTV